MRLLALLICLFSAGLHAQIDTLPDDHLTQYLSASQITARYYAIDFTREQRDSIGDREIEVILLIDTAGRASLYDVNFVTEPWIRDSLEQATRDLPPNFRREDDYGQRGEYVYTLLFTFPRYTESSQPFYSPYWQEAGAYRRAKLEDFEYLERSPQRLDILYAGSANQFIGSPARYLGFGGGFKMDIAYTNRRSRVYGLFTNFYGNKLRQPFTLDSSREQNSGPPTLLVGLQYGQWKGNWLFTGEAGFAQINVSPSLSDADRDWLRIQGASFGIAAHRSFALGPGSTDYMYGSPVVTAGHINVHGGIRYHAYDHGPASGLMVELGVGYRLSTFTVERYKLKDEFLSERY